MTEEKKQEYLQHIAKELGVAVELIDIRKGSIIFDVKVPSDVAQKLKEDKTLEERLGAKSVLLGGQASMHANDDDINAGDLLVLQSGDRIDVDIGLYAYSTVGGVIFHDDDADGVFNPTKEKTMAG